MTLTTTAKRKGPLPPGSCKPDDLVQLSLLTKDKDVLMLGAYCGRGAAAIGMVCKSLTVVEDFQSYDVDWMECGKEFMRVCGEYDARITLIQKDIEDQFNTEGNFNKYDVVYIDSDYLGNLDRAIEISGCYLKSIGIVKLLHHTNKSLCVDTVKDGFLTHPLKIPLKSFAELG